jgi:hypothetical protein
MAEIFTWGDAAQSFIRRASDDAMIPVDPRNSDYALLINGQPATEFAEAIPPAVIAPYVAPPAPPISVTPWQARSALAGVGKLAAVEAAVAALGVTHPAHIAWHYAERIRRDSPLIAALAGPLNLSDADLDALFEVAKGLSL